VLADSGEDAIAWCPQSEYAANVELAEAVPPAATRPPPTLPMAKVATPGMATCEEVAALLGLPLSRTVKCIMLAAERTGVRRACTCCSSAATTRSTRSRSPRSRVSESFRWASEAEIILATGCPPGYIGPVGIPADLPLIVDRAVAVMADFVCGANVPDFHLTGVNFGRDCRQPDGVADIRNGRRRRPSPDGKGTLEILRGIEVGHVFALGSKYSEAMGATFLDADGQSRVMEMGCYGIGVTRVVAAAIEQNHDDRGIIWPTPIAPFTVAIAPSATTAARRCARSPTGCTTSSRRAVSTCCSTTAANALA